MWIFLIFTAFSKPIERLFLEDLEYLVMFQSKQRISCDGAISGAHIFFFFCLALSTDKQSIKGCSNGY